MSLLKSCVPLLALTLAACSSSAPPPTAGAATASTTTATHAPVTPVASTAIAAAASVAAKAAPPVPVGTCGSQDKVPEADRIANTAKWTTASEQDNFGYDVYRGESKDGPFAKITKQPIAGGGTTDETHHYQFRDDAIDPCKSYWYYVETISTSGQREKFTPTYEAHAKRRAAPTKQ